MEITENANISNIAGLTRVTAIQQLDIRSAIKWRYTPDVSHDGLR